MFYRPKGSSELDVLCTRHAVFDLGCGSKL